MIRLLDREADITTRYGGGFVQSIDGLAGVERRTTLDWFFYVNGIESPVGAADVQVQGGDRIWWDYRDWTAAMSVPAVVGSWPEPFAQASRRPIRGRSRSSASGPAGLRGGLARLAAAGVKAPVESGAQDGSASGPRVLVGPWTRVRDGPGG